LINIGFSGTNGNSGNLKVFNKAANAPINSDVDWILNGSTPGTQWGTSDYQRPTSLIDGYWVSTPDDGVRYPYNVGGNKTYVKGDGRTVNPAPNTYIRNPKDAPALVKAGIPSTENLAYADFIADISRFYDDTEANRLLSILAYEDIPEPLLGSALQSDGIITLTYPGLSTHGIIAFEGTATPTINVDTLELTAGLVYHILLGNGDFTFFSEEKGLVVYGMNGYTGAGANNFTINLNGSTAGSQWAANANKNSYNYNWNKRFGRYDNGTSIVPGNATNFGKDILGNNIDNLAEAIKYRRILAYLRKLIVQ